MEQMLGSVLGTIKEAAGLRPASSQSRLLIRKVSLPVSLLDLVIYKLGL